MILGDSTSGAQRGASILDCCLAVLCKTLKDKGVMVQGLTDCAIRPVEKDQTTAFLTRGPKVCRFAWGSVESPKITVVSSRVI